MSRRLPLRQPLDAQRHSGPRRTRKPLVLSIERLEDRTMLASGIGSSLPVAIVVGRTLTVPQLPSTPGTPPTAPTPSYFVDSVQDNQVTITYTVYNEQADPETSVLLTTTLQPGVTFKSASQQPDQSGQNLAWSLGTINGLDRVNVTLTVSLANPIPLQLDSGAHASTSN